MDTYIRNHLELQIDMILEKNLSITYYSKNNKCTEQTVLNCKREMSSYLQG